ncbi:hypothetical protein [uncultured Methanolobus sp.]|uniref:hypothetical protein n=1 Tax=uncultured Methanolobus sp. TaxID=218300 RepID=UPI0029C97D32|nr:hypothetical protein [uncultured Methanolobus sp.]
MSFKLFNKRNATILGAVAVLAAVIILSMTNLQTQQFNQEFEAVTIETSGEIPALDFNGLNEKSETILIGTVKEILPSKWNTPDGKRPAKLINDFGPNDTMYTDVVISVEQYLQNPLNNKEVIIRVEGGEDEYTIMDVDYEPSFVLNERVLLYLDEDISPLLKDEGQQHYVVTGLYQGKFTLNGKGMAVRMDKNMELEELLKIIEYGDNTESINLEGVPD